MILHFERNIKPTSLMRDLCLNCGEIPYFDGIELAKTINYLRLLLGLRIQW
jgi:hypothetical protein